MVEEMISFTRSSRGYGETAVGVDAYELRRGRTTRNPLNRICSRAGSISIEHRRPRI